MSLLETIFSTTCRQSIADLKELKQLGSVSDTDSPSLIGKTSEPISVVKNQNKHMPWITKVLLFFSLLLRKWKRNTLKSKIWVGSNGNPRQNFSPWQRNVFINPMGILNLRFLQNGKFLALWLKKFVTVSNVEQGRIDQFLSIVRIMHPQRKFFNAIQSVTRPPS